MCSLLCRAIQQLHYETAEKLGISGVARQDVELLLSQLQQLLVGISIMQDLTPRAKDSLVSFGERLSSRLFAAFLNQQVGLGCAWVGLTNTHAECMLFLTCRHQTLSHVDVENWGG